MKKAAKISLISLAGVAALLCAVTVGGAFYMVSYALQPKDPSKDMVKNYANMEKNFPGLGPWLDSLQACAIMKDTAMAFDGGRTLHAWYAAAEKPSAKTAILVHGYTDSPYKMMMFARMYRDSLGYNVLLPHLSYHCLSDGPAVQMGWKDRLDVMRWTEVAHEVFADTLQVVHGVSMGAATTMMLSGEDTPDYIRGFIEDCGYTSVWDEYKGELKNQFGLPTFPILHASSLLCRIKYGWGFKEASSVKQLARCSKPMMFIHGDSDTYVPTAMVYVNYDAKTSGYKELWLSEGCVHANTYKTHPDEYLARVRKFLETQIE